MAIKASVSETKEPRIIKKYQNRKLYDTQDSCYITLDEIAKLIQQGDDVTVIDNRTKNDVTSIILTQILVDQEKNLKSILPLSMLKEIIRSGNGSLYDFIQRYVLIGIENATVSAEEATRYVDRLVARGEITKAEGKTLTAQLAGANENDKAQLDTRIKGVVEESIRRSTNLGVVEEKLRTLNERISRIETGSAV